MMNNSDSVEDVTVWEDGTKYKMLPFGCPFDGSLCDQGGCFGYDKPKGGRIVWVCPRYDADFMELIVKELGIRGSSYIAVFKVA